MVCLDRATGKPRWSSPRAPGLKIAPATGSAPRVVASDGVVVLCHNTQTFGFSAKDGSLLWRGRTQKSGHHCPNDLFVIEGLIWSAHTGTAQQKGTHFTALDLETGKTAKDFVAENLPGFPMHPRCYPSRATERYIMTAGMGTEFYEIGGTTVDINHVVRGSCIYGVMPCNGLLYKPTDSCACYYQSKLEYLCALAPAAQTARSHAEIPEDKRLERGPAYADAQTPSPDPGDGDGETAGEWPMYRGGPSREAYSGTSVPAVLAQSWRTELGGKLTPPVIAEGLVFVASADAHTLHALDARTGKPRWRYTAEGRIDSPPTVAGGRVHFGCADGRAYCLRARDGATAWRYLVAPEERQIVSRQQVESLWPLNGSLLVQGGTVYALAGRNMFFDGGMRLALLDSRTGRKRSETVLNELIPGTDKNLQTLIAPNKSMPLANPDLLSSDGRRIYMQTQKFDLEGKRLEIGPQPPSPRVSEGDDRHVFCQTGFLDEVWFHRSHMVYGDNCGEGWRFYYRTQDVNPCGRLLAVDGKRVYGFRADNLGNVLLPTPRYRLYAADLNGRYEQAVTESGKGDKSKKDRAGGRDDPQRIAGGYRLYWQMPSPPLLANAMVVAGGSLCVAGPPDVADETKMLGFLPGADDEANRQLEAQEAAWRGKRGGLLCVVSAEDGKVLASYKTGAPPVWDGMAAAGGELFLSLQDGAVVRWSGK
jgi:outer membrane protein assembly factor BamB